MHDLMFLLFVHFCAVDMVLLQSWQPRVNTRNVFLLAYCLDSCCRLPLRQGFTEGAISQAGKAEASETAMFPVD